jgi:hypothetical protein
MVLGDPDKVALVILGTREEILKKLDDAAREIEHSYGAEHDNALHTEYESGCPECRKHGPTTRVGEDSEPDAALFGEHHNAAPTALSRGAERRSGALTQGDPTSTRPR